MRVWLQCGSSCLRKGTQSIADYAGYGLSGFSFVCLTSVACFRPGIFWMRLHITENRRVIPEILLRELQALSLG